jgi:hypothetical protein
MSSRTFTQSLAAIVFAAALAGCRNQPATRATISADALSTGNGIIENGIIENGIIENGIIENGIIENGVANTVASSVNNGLAPDEGTNGLAENGFQASAFEDPRFKAWFSNDPGYSDMVMRYVARCVLDEGATLSYDHVGPDGSLTQYAWTGALGIAPKWTTGPIGEVEQQLVTACLAAHVNGLGQHVTVSLRGFLENGQKIKVVEGEESGWRFAEACFFGNLFVHQGVFDALMPDSLDPVVSTPRGCAAEFGKPGECKPMLQAGKCADLCTLGDDGKTWADCTLKKEDGTQLHFKPVQVFLQDSDVYRCGDGVCQSLTENSTTCPVDCGAPPAVCGNGTCEAGEDNATCPADCPATAAVPACGDGVCDAGEDATTCPDDCRPTPPAAVCGNGQCESGEDSTTCPADCPAPPSSPVCGDGTCEGGETSASCPADCPAPPQTAPVCGNYVCELGEDPTTCPADCQPATLTSAP